MMQLLFNNNRENLSVTPACANSPSNARFSWGKEKILLISQKVSEPALIILGKMGELFVKIATYLLNLYAKKVCGLEIREQPQDSLSGIPLVDQSISNQLADRAIEIQQAGPEVQQSKVPLPLFYYPSQTALVAVGGAVIPYHSATLMPSQSFGTTALTAQFAYRTVYGNLNQFMDPEFVQKWHLAPQPLHKVEGILYNTGMVTAAGAINYLASGRLTSPLHFAVAVAMFPPVQHAVVNTRGFRQLSSFSHQVLDLARERAVTLITPVVEPFVHRGIDALVRKGGTAVENKLKEWVGPIEVPGSENPGILERGARAAGGFLLQGIENVVVEEGGKVLAEVKKRTTRGVACHIVDTMAEKSILAGLEIAKIATVNNAALALYAINPLAGAVGYVLGDGINLTVSQLALRVTGAAIFVFTGSALAATVIVYGPGLVRYGLTICGKYKRKKVQEKDILDEPAVQALVGLMQRAGGCGKRLLLGDKNNIVITVDVGGLDEMPAMEQQPSRPAPKPQPKKINRLVRVITAPNPATALIAEGIDLIRPAPAPKPVVTEVGGLDPQTETTEGDGKRIVYLDEDGEEIPCDLPPLEADVVDEDGEVIDCADDLPPLEADVDDDQIEA